jgi:hypothetical protein
VSEGALDPLGLYQIADQFAVKLVPAVLDATLPAILDKAFKREP